MTNEYGMTLDRAGYAPSIMQRDAGCRCALCGKSDRYGKLDRHEPFHGIANRKKSQELGMWVTLCHFGCHEGPGSVHDDPAQNERLMQDAQRAAMLAYGWSREEFIQRFGKSHLTEEECQRLLTPAKTAQVVQETKDAPDWERVHEIVARLFPTHVNIDLGARGGFRVIDGPELPF